jgi:hypothetical protein
LPRASLKPPLEIICVDEVLIARHIVAVLIGVHRRHTASNSWRWAASSS